MNAPAAFWTPLTDTTVQCLLCPHRCRIASGKRGRCGVRENQAGKLVSLIYSSCSSIAVDPIEKKPLFHFLPGSSVYSLGSVGCTMGCEHCQNYHIATATPETYPLQDLPPKEAVAEAQQNNCAGIAWTYNEPTIWHEYVLDSARLAKDARLATVSVTNGYINPEPLRTLAPYLDAMNIDVKAFTESFYQRVCKARLAPVLEACELAHSLGIHLEVTYLLIPGYNDTKEELQKFCRWVADRLSVQTPVHFSRFHPDFRMTSVASTPLGILMQARSFAQEAGLQYVYLGNTPHDDYENTYCPTCHALLVERHGFAVRIVGLADGRCSVCQTPIPVVTSLD